MNRLPSLPYDFHRLARMVPHGTRSCSLVGSRDRLDLEIADTQRIPEGERQDGRSGWGRPPIDPRLERLRMFLTSTIAATDQASTSQVEISWCALNSRSDPASLFRKRAPSPLLSSPEFELV